MTWAIWLTGLPGSGKSSIARALFEKLANENSELMIVPLQMDQIRKQLVPKPKYTQEERDLVYKKLAEMTKEKVDQGICVIIDATANKKEYRDFARSQIPEFYEVYIKCNLETAIERESKRTDHPAVARMYERALKRLKGETVEQDTGDLGQVIGIDVPYEDPENPELTIDSENTTPEEAAEQIIDLLK